MAPNGSSVIQTMLKRLAAEEAARERATREVGESKAADAAGGSSGGGKWRCSFC
jgi:hypothetical protein